MNLLGNLDMYLSLLKSDPMLFVVYIVFVAAAILLSLMLHEIAHGYVAYRCGDPTAKMLGRLSLNPLRHLDPIGTACMVLIGFGWAKPVPVNPRNFRNYRRDDILVSIAGIVTNFCLFLLCTALMVGLNGLIWTPEAMAANGGKLLYEQVTTYAFSRQFIDFYSHLMRMPSLMYVQWFLTLMAGMNLGLAFFNLLPIPPLDGSHLLNDLVLKDRFRFNQKFQEISRFLLLVLCVSGLLGRFLGVVTGAVEGLMVNLFVKIAGQG